MGHMNDVTLLPETLPSETIAPQTIAVPAAKRTIHIPGLDGIRALAFLLVLISHAGLDRIFPGGFAVTVFFFLSGYLITTLLRREFETDGTISFRKFYLRRVLRIFPPMYMTILFILLLTILGPMRATVDTSAVIVQLLHFTNYQIILHSAVTTLPGTHVLWSLAVEEHYYLLFPLLFLILMKYFTPRGRFAALVSLCAVVLIWRSILVFVFHAPENRTFMASDTRIDSILFGSILAVTRNPVIDRIRARSTFADLLLLGGAVALLLFTFLYRSDEFRESIRYTLQGIALFPLFFLVIAHPQWPLFRWLDIPPMRALGVLSYTLYLIHFWAIDIVRMYAPNLTPGPVAIAAGLVSLAYATASYFFVERPCARLRKALHA